MSTELAPLLEGLRDALARLQELEERLAELVDPEPLLGDDPEAVVVPFDPGAPR